jgi:hypothetical protein
MIASPISHYSRPDELLQLTAQHPNGARIENFLAFAS